jgi:hypothetical protein
MVVVLPSPSFTSISASVPPAGHISTVPWSGAEETSRQTPAMMHTHLHHLIKCECRALWKKGQLLTDAGVAATLLNLEALNQYGILARKEARERGFS